MRKNDKRTLHKTARDKTGNTESIIQRVACLTSSGQYQKGLEVARSAPWDSRLRNAAGVCLMRMGRAKEAVDLYRSLVLQPGCTWTRPDIPLIHKTNFATALLLAGHPAGCLEILDEILNDQLAVVQNLRTAIVRWQKGLKFWQKLDWRVGRVEPRNCFVPIDFEPGQFDWPPQTRQVSDVPAAIESDTHSASSVVPTA